jgi:hypothetical protein
MMCPVSLASDLSALTSGGGAWKGGFQPGMLSRGSGWWEAAAIIGRVAHEVHVFVEADGRGDRVQLAVGIDHHGHGVAGPRGYAAKAGRENAVCVPAVPTRMTPVSVPSSKRTKSCLSVIARRCAATVGFAAGWRCY